MKTRIAINEPGLVERGIYIDADSTVELVKHDSGVNIWYALLVDGQHHDLVMWKHTLGRPQHMEALNRALSEVQAAIAAAREDGALRLENEKLRAVMLDLVVFGSAAIDQEADDEDRENAAAVLEASIKQARMLLGLRRAALAEAHDA